MSLAIGNIIAPVLGGALSAAGDANFDKYTESTKDDLIPECVFPNIAPIEDGEEQIPRCLGNGFAYSADVMSMITLCVLLIYGSLGWIFRPKSNFEKMNEGLGKAAGHDFEDIVFDEEHEEQKLFKGKIAYAKKNDGSRTGSFNIESI